MDDIKEIEKKPKTIGVTITNGNTKLVYINVHFFGLTFSVTPAKIVWFITVIAGAWSYIHLRIDPVIDKINTTYTQTQALLRNDTLKQKDIKEIKDYVAIREMQRKIDSALTNQVELQNNTPEEYHENKKDKNSNTKPADNSDIINRLKKLLYPGNNTN